MKVVFVVIVVVIVVAASLGGFFYYLNYIAPKQTVSIPQTEGIISVTDVNHSTNQKWYESLSGSVGVSNITTFYDTLSYVASPGSPIPFPFNQSGKISINYANFAAFVSNTNSSLVFGYAKYSSFNFAQNANSTIFHALSNTSTNKNQTSGSVDGAFYLYIYALNDGHYSGLIYAIYIDVLMFGIYYGSVNISASQMSHLVGDQVQILNTYKEIGSVNNNIVSVNTVDTYMGPTWVQNFNGNFETHNINVSVNYATHILFENSSYYKSLFNAYDSFNSFAFAGFSSYQNASLGIGYGSSQNPNAVANAYENISEKLLSPNSGLNAYLLNKKYNGLTYSVFVGTSSRNDANQTNFTFSLLIGMKNGYLVAMICYSLYPDTNALIQVLEAESNLL